jgi:predicted transcriptional regulator
MGKYVVIKIDRNLYRQLERLAQERNKTVQEFLRELVMGVKWLDC